MYHSRAIILKKDEWGEADWLVTAFTEQFGKIRLLAQGSRKHGAKLQGHLEPGSLSDISFVVGRNGYRLTTARLQVYFPTTRGSWLKFHAATMVRELLNANLFEEHERAPVLFATTAAVLGALEQSTAASMCRRLVAWFYLRFFTFLGLLPAGSGWEAERWRLLVDFARQPIGELEPSSVREQELEAALTDFIAYLGDAVQAPQSITPSALALY